MAFSASASQSGSQAATSLRPPASTAASARALPFDARQRQARVLQLPALFAVARTAGARSRPAAPPAGPRARGRWPRRRRAARGNPSAPGRRTGRSHAGRRENAPSPAIAIIPIPPVRATCVPPQAERSKSCDVDQPQRSLALRRLAQPERRGLLGATRNGSSPDDPPRRRGWPRPRRGRSRSPSLARQIDRRGLSAEVKALGARAEQPIERRRQHVLAGVLLHVIEAPRPVDRALDRAGGRQRDRRRAAAVRPRCRRRRATRASASVPTSNGCPPEVG